MLAGTFSWRDQLIFLPGWGVFPFRLELRTEKRFFVVCLNLFSFLVVGNRATFDLVFRLTSFLVVGNRATFTNSLISIRGRPCVFSVFVEVLQVLSSPKLDLFRGPDIVRGLHLLWSRFKGSTQE